VLTELGDHATAEPMLADALAARRAECGGDDERVVFSLYDHGRALLLLGRVGDADARFAEAAAMADRLELPRSRLTSKLHQGLGLCAFDRRDFAVAEAEFARAHAIADGVAPPVDVGDLLLQQANLQQVQRKFAEAERLFEQAGAVLRSTDAPLQEATAATGLGNLRVAQGRFDDAAKLFQRALELGERQLGPDHPLLIRRLCNLAGVHAQTDRIDLAEPLLVRAVALGKGVDARYDDGVANATVNLGNVRAMQNRPEEALSLWNDALLIRERRDGKDGREVGSILENMVGVLEELGRTDEAKKVRDRLEAIRGGRR
jgi:tetratricopeptide (TPR) repeat protein